MADRLRVGVIGRTGKGSYGHGIDSVWAEVPDSEVVAVADEHDAGRRDAQKRMKAATAYADYREMLAKERLDIVAIGPRWIDQHREVAIAAAEQGCHIYMEKPFVPTPAQADEVIRTCEMRHTKLALATFTQVGVQGSEWSLRLPPLRAGLYTFVVGASDEAGRTATTVTRTLRLR